MHIVSYKDQIHYPNYSTAYNALYMIDAMQLPLQA